MDAAVLTIHVLSSTVALTMDFLLPYPVTIEKGGADNLLERLTKLGVLPYCGPMRGTTGSAYSEVTVSTIRDMLGESNKLEDCAHFTSLSEHHASETGW